MRKKRLSIELIGGIGNQLFCYFAGLAIANKINTEVEFVHNELPLSHPQHDSLLSDLQISIPWAKSMEENTLRNLIRKKSDLVFYKIKHFGKLRDKYWGVYRESKLGSNEETFLIFSALKKQRIRQTLKLIGHFQSLEYFFYCKTHINYGLFYPKNPSRKFVLAQNNPNLQCFSLVHVRRTDFHNNRNTVGLLSEKYYENAINLLLESTPKTGMQIIVVSDDLDEAKKVIPKKFHSYLNFLENTLPDNPAELLITMSKAENFILSNSTFSLWSALLAQNLGLVIYPEPFNFDANIKIINFPDSWLAVQSDFE